MWTLFSSPGPRAYKLILRPPPQKRCWHCYLPIYYLEPFQTQFTSRACKQTANKKQPPGRTVLSTAAAQTERTHPIRHWHTICKMAAYNHLVCDLTPDQQLALQPLREFCKSSMFKQINEEMQKEIPDEKQIEAQMSVIDIAFQQVFWKKKKNWRHPPNTFSLSVAKASSDNLDYFWHISAKELQEIVGEFPRKKKKCCYRQDWSVCKNTGLLTSLKTKQFSRGKFVPKKHNKRWTCWCVKLRL